MNSSEHNNKKYSIDYAETQMDRRNQLRISQVIGLIDPCEQLLDLGCWDGFIMDKVLKSGKAKAVIGLDNSQKAVSMGQKKGLDVRYVESADTSLPLNKNSFDCVFAGEIIEHVYDVDKFIREINRVLKKDGQLIITTPNLASFGSRVRLMFGRTPWMIENLAGSNDAGHIRYFTFDSLCEILTDRGFKIGLRASNVIQIGGMNIENSIMNKKLCKLGTTIIIKCYKN